MSVSASEINKSTNTGLTGIKNLYGLPKTNIDPDQNKKWFWRVWPLLKQNKWMLLLTIIGAFTSILIQALNPAILGMAIDSIKENSENSQQWGPIQFAYLMAALALSRALIFIAYRWGLARLMFGLESDLRSIFFNQSTRLSFSFFDRMQTGQLISRANSDIRALQMFLAFGPFMFLTLISFAVAIVYMIKTDLILTILAVFSLPAVYMLGMKLREVMFPLNWINQQRLADLTSIVDENINGVRIVRSFVAEERQISLLAKAAEKLKWAGDQVVETNARYGPLMENIPRLGIAAVLYYGGILVMEDKIGIGALVAFNLYMMQLVTPFRMIGVFLMMERRAAASAQRIFEVLDEEPEISDRENAITLNHNDGGEIRFKNLSFAYANKEPVLKNINLTIKPGERVAIVGRTGSGKSTLSRLLGRFYQGQGEIFIDGHEIKDISLNSLHKNIGMVMEEAFLFSCSVHENIAFGAPDASRDQVMAAAKAAQAHEFISELPDQYDAIIGERGYTLSGGQRQRIALARIFLINPSILVLDDATSAIDVKVESKIYQSLERLFENRTTIIIAHRHSTISLADRILLIENGELVADGSHAELSENSELYRLILAQAEDEKEADGLEEIKS